MGRDKIRIAGADELPPEEQKSGPPHPFSKMNRGASRGEVVNASLNAARRVYDQIAEEHNKAINEFYEEFDQYREVSARRIRQIERWAISYQIQRALRVDAKRFGMWLEVKRELARGWFSIFRNTTEIERLAREAARVHTDVALPELVNQVELLAMMRTGQAAALRWRGQIEDLKEGPFAEFYSEEIQVNEDGSLPIGNKYDSRVEVCCVGDLLLLKRGALSVIKGQVSDAAKEATA